MQENTTAPQQPNAAAPGPDNTKGTPSYTVPAGTYPSPVSSAQGGPANVPPQNAGASLPPAPPAPPQKVRRVGTFTMALCLIAVGVILVLWVFVPSINYITIARLSPIVLVFLGIEILVANIFHKDEKLKYDGLSIFISLLLIGGSLIMAVVPQFIYWEIEGNRTSNRLSAELSESAYQALQDAGIEFASVECYVGFRGTDFSEEMTVADIQPEHYVQLRLYFGEDYADAAAFAGDVERAVKALQSTAPHIDYGSFYSYSPNGEEHYTGDEHYTLDLQNRSQFSLSPARMVNQIITTYWAEDVGHYISEWEHNDRLAHPENYAIEEVEIDSYQDEPASEVPEDTSDTLSTPVSGEQGEQAASAPTSLPNAA